MDYFLNQDPSNYEISLLTVGRGDEIFMLGGHLLLRIYEPEKKDKDISVNWGIFKFDDPNFYINYALGKLDYRVVEVSTKYIIYKYQKVEKRRIYENKLNLTSKQKNTIIKRVTWWLKPENSTYRYHLFFNNCSTIIRDLFSEALGKDFDLQLKDKKQKTFRHMGRKYFSNYPFFAFLAPLMITSSADKTITLWERFIMPIEAPYILKNIKRIDDDKNILKEKLIGPMTTLSPGQDIGFATFEYSLIVLFSLIFMVILSILAKKLAPRPFKLRLLGFTLFLIGIFNSFWSILMILLWAVSQHTYTFHNANLMILWPTDIIFSIVGLYLLFFNTFPHYKPKLLKLFRLNLQAHLIGMITQLVLWNIGFIEQDVSFIYFYVLGPYILLSIFVWRELSPTKKC